MIELRIDPRPRPWYRRRRPPHVLAVFSFRYDAHLVPAMLQDIRPLTDGWVAYDDRRGDGVFSNEVDRRVALLSAAREAGATWALAIDPDERFEKGLEDKIDRLTRWNRAAAYSFRLREMFAPDSYRVDGIWGQKRMARLLNLTGGVNRPAGDLHLPWQSFVAPARVRHTDINLYHLKMITRERRQARADLYNHLDPDRRMQPVGYDYLADETGVVLERIPGGREFRPAHDEDGGLWMPSVRAG